MAPGMHAFLMDAPTTPKPSSIIAQVASSGTAEDVLGDPPTVSMARWIWGDDGMAELVPFWLNVPLVEKDTLTFPVVVCSVKLLLVSGSPSVKKSMPLHVDGLDPPPWQDVNALASKPVLVKM